jgi:hypothetical protein
MVQAPENIQNLNRYSYVVNNPLNKTDPSGYIFATLAIWAFNTFATQAFLATTIGTIIQTAITAYQFYGYAKLAIGVAQAVNGGGTAMANFAGGYAKSFAKGQVIQLLLNGMTTAVNSVGKEQGSAHTGGHIKQKGTKNSGSSTGAKNAGNPLTAGDQKRAEAAVDRAIGTLNKFIVTLQEGKGEEYEQIAAEYGYKKGQLSEFGGTAEFLIDQSRAVADLLVQYKHGGHFIYSAYSGGDAYTPGKIAIGKASFSADTLIHEGAHKVFANDHGADGFGPLATSSRHTIDASTASTDLPKLAAFTRRSSITDKVRIYNRNWLKMSAYRFEYSVHNAASK